MDLQPKIQLTDYYYTHYRKCCLGFFSLKVRFLERKLGGHLFGHNENGNFNENGYHFMFRF